MRKRGWLRIVFYVNLLVVVAVVGYKIYLDLFDAETEASHARQVERIQEDLAAQDSFDFAVVGNINNSIGVFERQIVPMLNASDAEFVVSAGNAVSDGGEDKYRSLRGTLRGLEVPYLLTFGQNEAAGFGGFRFYRHFGPYFFAFTAGNARFVFLDTTGETAPAWQLHWLEEELAQPGPEHTLLFMGRPIWRPEEDPVLAEDEDYLGPPAFRQALIDLIGRYEVDAVFAGSVPLFDHRTMDGTHFVTTGGAGGLVVSDEDSFHHFVMVSVAGDDLRIRVRPLDVGQNPVAQTLESLWLFVHSLFFTGYLNFLLILSALVLVAVKLHGLVFEEKEYYPGFTVDPAPFLQAPLRVAMFTNNYLPFIGGVPLSVERLRRGLQALGKEVLVVAPRYDGAEEGKGDGKAEEGADDGRPEEGDDGGMSGEAVDDGTGVVRVPSLLSFGREDEFRLANLLQPGVVRRVKRFQPDVIHLHHPFWLGSLGLWVARRLGVPAIYTYHTRFEHYAHYVPVPGRLVRNLISHYLIKRFANKCSGVVVPTPTAREYLRAIGVKTRVLVQPTAVDCDAFRNVDPHAVAELRSELGLGDEPVLVSVSRLSKEKNIDFMIDAVAELVRRGAPPFRFLLIGQGEERAHLEDRIEMLGLGDVVLMPGLVPAERMPLYYQLGDLFLFASTTETQGMVVLEAMAAGLPVVAVRSSGIDDLVQNGVNGFKTGEDRTAWAARVRQLLDDEALRSELADRARSFAWDHDIEPFAREVLAFYATALALEEERRNGVTRRR